MIQRFLRALQWIKDTALCVNSEHIPCDRNIQKLQLSNKVITLPVVRRDRFLPQHKRQHDAFRQSVDKRLCSYPLPGACSR
jgi:hypothetical protein